MLPLSLPYYIADTQLVSVLLYIGTHTHTRAPAYLSALFLYPLFFFIRFFLYKG